MAHAMRIDSLKFARKLEAAGLDRKAAEAIAEGVTEVDVSDLATKADIAELGAATKADIAELRAATKADIVDVRHEIAAVRSELKADIAQLRGEMKEETASLRNDISNLRAELFRQLWIMAAGIVAVTFTLSKIFP